MICENCGGEIFWYHENTSWCHFRGTYRCYGWADVFAEPKIEDEGKKSVCKHCGNTIHFDEYSQRWGHFFDGERNKDVLYEYCYADLNPRYKTEPKDLIILDEVKPIPTDEPKIYCENCDYVVVCDSRGSWVHLNTGKCICKDGVIVYAHPKIDKRCGNCYMYQKAKGICLYFGSQKQDNDKCSVWELDRKPFMPKDEPIPTDCISCKEIRYFGTPKGYESALCYLEIIDPNKDAYILFKLGDKGIPKSHTPPTWCPSKAKEVKNKIPTDCMNCDHKYLSSDGHTLTGTCSILPKDNILFQDSGLRDHIIPNNFIPPIWCPLKAKEPEKTALRNKLEFFIDKHDRGRLSTEVLIDIIITRVEEGLYAKTTTISTDSEVCSYCGGLGKVPTNREIQIGKGMVRLFVDCPECCGLGI